MKFEIMAVIALLSVISCDRLSQDPGYIVEFRVGAMPLASRAVDVHGGNETSISDLQVFVFRPDGNLDGYSASLGSRLTMRCTAGHRTVCVIANSPSLSHVRTLAELDLQTSRLSDNSSGKLLMYGRINTDVSAGTEVIVNVSRICAKVVIERIEKRFASPTLQSRYFRINRIYVTNVAGDAPLTGIQQNEPIIWYNRMGIENDSPTILKDEVWSIVQDAYTHVHTFYVYPNPTVLDSRGGNWSPRHTRLVVEASVGSTRCWYVVDMPVLERNTAYVLKNLVITRLGAVDEENVSGEGSLELDFEIVPWDTAVSYTENL